MITGAHSIIYSTNPDADRAFLRDVLELPSIDVGGGWLIFGLPPAELAMHPSGENDVHELYLICENVEALVKAMAERSVATSPVADRGWGLVTEVTLPGGGKLGIYEARHARPPVMAAKAPAKRTRKPAQKTRATAKKRSASAAKAKKKPAPSRKAPPAKKRKR